MCIPNILAFIVKVHALIRVNSTVVVIYSCIHNFLALFHHEVRHKWTLCHRINPYNVRKDYYCTKLLNNRRIKSNIQTLSYLISKFADEIYAGRQERSTYLVLTWCTFILSHRIHSDYQLFLSDHSQEHVDQLDSTKSMLATIVNTVMSLWGVKELVMRADRLENWEKAKER